MLNTPFRKSLVWLVVVMLLVGQTMPVLAQEKHAHKNTPDVKEGQLDQKTENSKPVRVVSKSHVNNRWPMLRNGKKLAAPGNSTSNLISGILSCYSETIGVTCINHGTHLEFFINKVVTGLTGGATAYDITIGSFRRTTNGGDLGMASNLIHTETSIYASNYVLSGVSIRTPDAGTVHYPSFTDGPGKETSVNNIVNDWRYVGGTGGPYAYTLKVRGNVDWPITGYSVIGRIYLYLNKDFVVPDLSVRSATAACMGASYEGATGFIVGPINTRTGGYDYTVKDLSLLTSAGDLSFRRSYASPSVGDWTPLSDGWTHNHDIRLIFPADPEGEAGRVWFKSDSPNKYVFNINSDGTFSPYPGLCANLVQEQGQYLLKDNRQNTYAFNLEGRLLSYSDAVGHTWNYYYLAGGELDRVEADGGTRYIQLDYDAAGRIIAVGDHTNREVAFGYDGNGDLTAVTDVTGATWTYEYHPTLAHHLTRAAAPGDVTIEATDYYPDGRAWRQYDGEGNLIAELSYDLNGTTTMTDGLGNTTTHRYDARGTLVESEDASGGVQEKEYDHNFRPTSITNDVGHTLGMTWSADGLHLLGKTDPLGHSTAYTYDAAGNLTSTTDPLGHTTTYTYNGNLLVNSTDALGAVTMHTYTAEGYLASTTDPLGRTTSYAYDSHGQRTSMTDPNGNTWSYTYDSLGRLTHTTDPRGRVTYNEYNAAGQLLRTTQNHDPNRPQNDQNLYNLVAEYGYDLRGNQITMTDTLGRVTQYVYDDVDRLIQTIDAAGNITANTYDAAGRLVSTTDALGHTTTHQYDPSGRLLQTTNPLGIAAGTTTFNAAANTSTVTDSAGNVWVYYYDALGRVVKMTDPLGGETLTSYDPNGNVSTRTDPLGRVTTHEYDELNRLVKTTDPNGGVTETVYNLQGQRVATIDARGGTTTYTYDVQGRLVATTDPLGRVTQTEYDLYGRRTASIDALGARTEYSYDLLDRVITVTDTLGNTTHTTYDALGNVLTRTDANGNITAYTYDSLNRTVTVTDPNGHAATNTYDAAGNLIAVTNALGETATYGYDALNRQVSVTDPLGNTTQTTYNSLGQVSSTIDANGVVTYFEYDELGRQTAMVLNYKPAHQADAETNVRYEYEYNAAGNRTLVRDPLGSTTSFTYDVLNRVTGRTDPLGNTWVYTYDLAGNQTSMTDGVGRTTNYIYDAAGQLTVIDYPAPDADISFGYNLNGQRISMTDGLGTTTWSYDALNRLLSVQDAQNASIGYGYDAAGRRTSLAYPNSNEVAYNYDASGQLVSVTDWDNQITSYVYDAAGRLVSVSRPNGVDSGYSYDDAGRVIQLQHTMAASSLAVYSYTYDPAGNLTQAVENVLQAENEYELTIDIVGQGSVTRSDDGPYRLNDVVLLSAVPDAGWTFTGWSECAGIDPCSVTITGNKTVTANFTQDEYALEVISEHGTVARSPEQATYHYGDVVQLEAIPGEGWEFIGWSGGAEGMDNPVSVTVLGNTSVTASYGETSSPPLFADGFESGDLSAWDGAETGGGDLSVSAQAAATGGYGMQALINDTAAIKLYDNTPNGEKHYGTRFYLDPNSISIPAGSSGVNILTGSSNNWAFCLYLEKLGTDYRLTTCGREDDGDWYDGRPVYIQDEWQSIEMEWKAASAESANDGYLRLYVNDVLMDEVTGLDTDTLGINEIALGVGDIPAGTDGTIYFDDFVSRSGDYIGADPSGPQLSPPLVDLIFRDGFESADATAWGNVNMGGGNLGVTLSAAAIGGYGLQATASGNTSMYVTDYSPTGEKQYHARFYLDPSNFTLTTEDRVGVFSAYGSKTAFRVFLRYSGGTYWIRQEYQMDGSSYAGGVHHPLAAGWQALEFDWQAASAAEANDGSLSMSINGVMVETLGGIDNDTISVETAYMGLVESVDAGMSGSLHFDGFVSQRSGSIGLDPNGPSLSGPIPLPDLAFSDDFESGDLSKWSSASTNGGNLGVSADAAEQGVYGLKANISDTTSIYARYYPPIFEDETHVQFRFHPNSLSLANGKAHYLYDGLYSDTGSRLVRLELLRENDEYKLRAQVRRDDGTYANTGKYVISNDWHTLQVGWQAATADGANDGMLDLWIDDLLMEELTGVDNDLLLLDEIRLGAPSGLDSGTSGAMLYDGFAAYRSAPLVESASVPGEALPEYNNVSLGQPLLPRFLSDSPLMDRSRLNLETLTITYQYDALRRLTSATYSDGRSFNYTYDANGNTLSYTDPTSTTTYTYDSANQLLTAEKGESLWHYVYDANGSLVEILPNNTETNGAKRYTYNTANYLTKVETHNGAGWDVQAEMSYNGLGQRLSMDAAGVIAYYVMDENRPLTATTGSDTTSYLYGLGAIGEETDAWSYGLPDGTNTQRQLTDAFGEVTYAARYTPWGDTLDASGTGNFAFGYFGGLMDAATGLLYVGDGQYYDPSTGRFLTRNARPNQANPYLPFDPTGALFLPLALVSLVYGKKRRKSKWDMLVIVALLSLSAGLGVAACQIDNPTGQDIQFTAIVTPTTTKVTATISPDTVIISTPTPQGLPTIIVQATPCATPTSTPGLDEYGIIFTGTWDKEMVLRAVLKVGARFSDKLGGIGSAAAFKQVYGTPFNFYKTSGGGVCEGNQRIVVCYGDFLITDRLLVHELGHALQHSRYRDGTQGPYGSLENAQITDNVGNWVTGKQPNGVFKRTMLGYLSDKQPDVYHGPRYYDSAVGRNLGFTDWDSNVEHRARNEDFADMFMNWVYNSFDDSPSANGAGINRYEWMDKNMLGWITG